MNNKKSILNKKISEEELEKYCKTIALKSIKVIASKGNNVALDILEYKQQDILQDIVQEVSLQLILDNYIITKNAFKVASGVIYKYKKEVEKIAFSIDEEEEEKSDLLDKELYISYLHNSNEKKENKNIKKISIEDLGLTEAQAEILKMYINGTPTSKICDLLGIKSKGTISNTIKRIKQKASKIL